MTSRRRPNSGTASSCSPRAACSSSTTRPAEVLGRPATPFVADFVGADRGVQLLAVVPIERDDLFHPPAVLPGDTMLDARAQAAGADIRWAVVVDDGPAPLRLDRARPDRDRLRDGPPRPLRRPGATGNLAAGRVRRDAPTRRPVGARHRRRALSGGPHPERDPRRHAAFGGRSARRPRGVAVTPRPVAAWDHASRGSTVACRQPPMGPVLVTRRRHVGQSRDDRSEIPFVSSGLAKEIAGLRCDTRVVRIPGPPRYREVRIPTR